MGSKPEGAVRARWRRLLGGAILLAFGASLLGVGVGAWLHSAFAAEVVFSRIVVSDVDDSSFVVSWVTDVPADGSVRYGADLARPDLWTAVSDARGPNYTGYTHYVVVENGDPGEVRPATTYYLSVGSGGTTTNVPGSTRLTVTTGPTISDPTPAPNLFSGLVRNRDGSPAGGVLVYATLERVVSSQSERSLPLSGLTDDSGAFAVDVSRARVIRARSQPDYFRLSTTLADEKVIYELDAGRGNRISGTIDANTTSAGSAAPALERQFMLPTSDGASPGRAVTPTSALVVTVPPPVAPSSTPDLSTPARSAPLVLPTIATPTARSTVPVVTPALPSAPLAAATALATTPTPGLTPEVAASPTPPTPDASDGQRTPLAILGVIGAAVLLVSIGLALVVVGLAETRRR